MAMEKKKRAAYLLASGSDHLRTELKHICLCLEKVVLFPQQKGVVMLGSLPYFFCLWEQRWFE